MCDVTQTQEREAQEYQLKTLQKELKLVKSKNSERDNARAKGLCDELERLKKEKAGLDDRMKGNVYCSVLWCVVVGVAVCCRGLSCDAVCCSVCCSVCCIGTAKGLCDGLERVL